MVGDERHAFRVEHAIDPDLLKLLFRRHHVSVVHDHQLGIRMHDIAGGDVAPPRSCREDLFDRRLSQARSFH